MNSNSLYQQIQQLDLHMKSFASSLGEVQQFGQGFFELPFDKLNAVLQSEKTLFVELHRQLSAKVDRVEFSEIVHQKANVSDV